MARRRKAVPAPAPAIDRSHIVEDTGRAGEIVGIEGRRGAFRIVLEALNTKTETEWVELYGVGQDKQFTAVRPALIKKRRQPRGR
jgi:hypothetical protein